MNINDACNISAFVNRNRNNYTIEMKKKRLLKVSLLVVSSCLAIVSLLLCFMSHIPPFSIEFLKNNVTNFTSQFHVDVFKSKFPYIFSKYQEL